MSLISLFARKKAAPAVAADVPAPECAHLVLAPRWDAAQDIGKEDKIVSYLCSTCQESITPDQARSIGK